jgi:hypothetical protein
MVKVQSLPSWLGGKNLVQRIQQWQRDWVNHKFVPFDKTKALMVRQNRVMFFTTGSSVLKARGECKPSFVSLLLQEMEGADTEQEDLIRDCASAAFAGMYHTTGFVTLLTRVFRWF